MCQGKTQNITKKKELQIHILNKTKYIYDNVILDGHGPQCLHLFRLLDKFTDCHQNFISRISNLFKLQKRPKHN